MVNWLIVRVAFTIVGLALCLSSPALYPSTFCDANQIKFNGTCVACTGAVSPTKSNGGNLGAFIAMMVVGAFIIIVTTYFNVIKSEEAREELRAKERDELMKGILGELAKAQTVEEICDVYGLKAERQEGNLWKITTKI